MTKLGPVIPYLMKIQKIYKSRNTALEFIATFVEITGEKLVRVLLALPPHPKEA